MSFTIRTFALAAVIFFSVSSTQATGQPNPTFEGKAFSEWLKQVRLEKNDPQGRKAFDLLTANARKLGDAVPLLALTLADDDEYMRFFAATMLKEMRWEARPATAALVKALQDPARTVRKLAAEALSQVQAYTAVAELTKSLEDDDPFVRNRAAHALILLDAPAEPVIKMLVKQLKHANSLIVFGACHALAMLGPEAAPAVPDLVKALKERDGAAVFFLARALAAIGPGASQAAPAVKQAAQKNAHARATLAVALWSISRDKDVPALLRKCLQETETDAQERSNAAIALWQIEADKQAVKALVDMAKTSKNPLREIDYLGQIGPAAKDAVKPYLIPMLADANLGPRAAIALGRIGPAAKEALPALARVVKDGKPLERTAAAAAICRIRPDKASIVALADLLKEDDLESDLRQYVAQELGLLGKAAQPAVPQLTALLKDADVGLRLNAATSLWLIDRQAEAVPIRLALCQSPDAAVRRTAVFGIGLEFREAGQAVVPVLIKLLSDRDVDVSTNAAEELGRLGRQSEPAVAPLIKVLEKASFSGNLSAACEALGQIGPGAKAAVPALKRHLSHPAKIVQVHAGLALWLIARDETAKEQLTAALANRNYQVRITAAEALWQMRKDDRVLPLLLRSLRDSNLLDESERNNEMFMAMRALGRIGPPAREAVPALMRRLHHYDAAAAQTAADALHRIDPDALKTR